MSNSSSPEPEDKRYDPTGLVDRFRSVNGLSDQDRIALLDYLVISTNKQLISAQQEIATLRQRLDEEIKKRLEAEQRQTLDHLTGVPNRKGFTKELEEALDTEKRYAREGSPQPSKGVVLMMIDLNKFKPINDNYGHAAGDAALILFTQTIQKMIRPGDTIARLGGDEFAIILPHANTQDAARHIEMIQKAIKSLDLDYQGHKINFGGTAIAHDCDLTKGYHENYVAADEILTAEKEKGRQAPAPALVPAPAPVPPTHH